MRLKPGPRARLLGGAGLLLVSLFLGTACSGRVAVEEKVPEAPQPSAQAWPMFGGSVHRNMADPFAKGLPEKWSVKKNKQANIKWQAQLGTMAYGGPVIAGGKIFVGTNNDKPRDPKIKGDKGVVMCFRESDGKFLWQAVHDKLPDPQANDTPKHGVASSPCVDGERLYYVSNRCELVCASTDGDEATGQAKIIWKLDMVKDLGVYPCYLANCSPLVAENLVFVVTGNGVDPGTHKLPAPKAPSFVAVHKDSGKVAWTSNLPGENIMEGQWSNPAAAEVDGKTQVIFPGGDGWLYAFEARSGELLWKFDCNPKKSTYKPGGPGDRAYLIATPVIWENKLYVGVGRDPEDGAGVGHLWCIDITKQPKNKDRDLSPVGDNFDPKAEVNKDSGLVWHVGGEVMPKPEDGSKEFIFSRTLSTVAVHDGLVYAAEMMGYLQCLDASTGKKYWDFDLKDSTWSSPFYADGKVYMGTDGGDLYIFEAGKELKKPSKINMEQPMKVPPVAANGVLYVNNGLYLYAITAK
jgi:outer membrane protein assembly factor BamB